jgi:hypothetical protein
VKRSGGDESLWVVIHGSNARKLSIAILISNSKNTMSFLLLLMSTLQQNWRRGQKQDGWGERERVEGERNGPNNACTYE